MEREVAVAAQWWADQLLKAQASPADRMGAEDDSPMRSAVALAMLGHMQAIDRADDPSAIDRFRENLSAALLASRSHLSGTGFGVAYGPDDILADAAVSAGIKVGMTTFPWKTVMWISPGSVRVSAGYAAAAVELPLAEEAPC